MPSLFAPRSTTAPTTIQKTNSTQPIQIQNEQDSVSYAESMLNRSGGDARAAFYMAAKEKGVDPDQFIEKLKGLGNLKGLASNVISSNPRAKMLFTLFSSMK